MTDKNTLDLARQWAEDIDADRQTLSQDTIDAAADLISSLPDAWVGTDTLREFISEWRTDCPAGDGPMILEQLESLLPAPPAPRTMDKIEWDDAEHHLAEATVVWADGTTSEVVMLHRHGDKIAVHQSAPTYMGLRELNPGILAPTGRKYRLAPEDDTPTSPIEDKPAPEPASPRPEDVPEGEEWQVETPFMGGVGYRHARQANPWFVTYPGHSERTWHVWNDSEVTLVARLVPETTEQDPPAEYGPYTRIEA